MSKTKEQKQNIIKDLKEKLAKPKSVVFVDFAGLQSKKLFQLRNELKSVGCEFTVVKKTLLRKVLEALKEKDFLGLLEKIEGQLALALGFGDEVVPAKLCQKFSEENEELKILGGVLGKEVLSKERVIELAKIPSKEVLLGRLVGSLNSPMTGFVRTLKGNLNNLIYILSKIKVKS